MFLYKFSIDVNDIVVLFYFYSVKNKSKILPLTGCHGNETSARYCEKVIFHFTVFLGISRVAKKKLRLSPPTAGFASHVSFHLYRLVRRAENVVPLDVTEVAESRVGDH